MDDFEDRPPTPPPHQLPPYYRQRRTSASLSLFGPSDSTAQAKDSPKLSPQEPAAKSSPSPKPPTQSQLLTAQDVSSWWGSSGTIRQWRERGTPATTPVIPTKQEERWKQAKQVNSPELLYYCMTDYVVLFLVGLRCLHVLAR